jgi:hypothetical protein
MPQRPSLISFILHRKSFWLGLFTLIFLCWVWKDSLVWRNIFTYNHKNFVIAADSLDGGLTLYTYEDPFAASDFHHIRIDYNHPDRFIKYTFEFEKPDIHYSTPIFLVISTTTAWLTWRWRKTVAALPQCHANP